MPASNDELRLARPFRCLLAMLSACAVVCGPASQGLALDGDLPGLTAGDQLMSGSEFASAPDDPFVHREIALSGFVEESFEDSLVRTGAPAGLSVRLKDALSSALDRRHLDNGDRFFVRYEQTVASDGREIGAGRIVSAEIITAAKGKIAFYSFRPTRGAEQLWLANGEALAAPAMRLPLETVSVSSGFGVRADPFEQPRNGLGAPSRLGTVGATINRATARGIALGLAPGPGRTASRGGASTFLMHNGVDLVAASGTPVLAASDGTVVGAAPNAGYGNWIRVDHGQNVATVYGHLSTFAPGISAGTKVQRGQVIGFVGSTGRSTGPHLHFEVINNGQAVDPMNFPRTKRASLQGADLENFRKLVRQSEAARQSEVAFQLISAVGVP
jgi:murein DD-endopeptidase MepM/ murein hydrolase activator NlpD